MKYIYILLLVFFSTAVCENVYAQSIKKHYISKPQSTGTIYFIFPVELFKSENDGELKYDITYQGEQEDLAIINITYLQSEMVPADSIVINYKDNNLISGKLTRIFAEPDKETWTHRYTFKADLKSLRKFYNVNNQPQITLFTRSKPFVTYNVIDKAWKNYANIGRKIVDVILINESE
jgi:hypothetical protein